MYLSMSVVAFSCFGAMIAGLLLHERMVPRAPALRYWLTRPWLPLAGFILALFLTQRFNLYQPDTTPNPLPPGDRWLISQTADGLTLKHVYHPPDTDRPVVVLFHGNGGRADDWSLYRAALVGAGYGVVMAEYRGYGGNPGKPTEPGLYADGESIIRALSAENIAIDKVILWGHSLGSGVAVELARRHKIAALILEAPYTSTIDVAARRFGWLPLDLMMWDQFRNADKIKHVQTRRILIMNGSEDGMIPPIQGERLAAQVAGLARYVRIDGGGHNDLLALGGWHAALEFMRLP